MESVKPKLLFSNFKHFIFINFHLFAKVKITDEDVTKKLQVSKDLNRHLLRRLL